MAQIRDFLGEDLLGGLFWRGLGTPEVGMSLFIGGQTNPHLTLENLVVQQKNP